MGLIDRFTALDTPVQVLLIVALAIAALVALVVLVGVLIVLASVLGAFTLGLGDESQQTAPAAAFEIQGTDSGAQVTHDGGDTVEARNLYVEVDGERQPWTAYGSAGPVGPGDSITVPAETGQRVRVIYDDGEVRQILAEETIASQS